jgi:hypothetical protein
LGRRCGFGLLDGVVNVARGWCLVALRIGGLLAVLGVPFSVLGNRRIEVSSNGSGFGHTARWRRHRAGRLEGGAVPRFELGFY